LSRIPVRISWALPRLLCGSLLVVAACSPSPLNPDPVGPSDGWRVFHPLPIGYNLEDVWAAWERSIWAVGAHGVIVHWDGETVERVDSPTRAWLTTISGRARDDIYAGGEDVLLHFDGRTWDLVRTFADQVVEDVLCREDGTVVVVGTMGAWTGDDGDWQPIAGLTDTSSVVWEADDGEVRVAAGSRIWRLSADGPMVELEAPDLTFTMADGEFVCGSRGEADHSVYRRGTNGNWEFWLEVGDEIRAVVDVGAFLFADNGGLYRREGSDWSRIWSNSNGRWIYALADGGAAGILACGHGGTLMAGERQGDEVVWHETAETIGYRYLNCFDGTGCDDIWAGEWYDRVLHYDGEQWRREFTFLPGTDMVSKIQVVADGGVLAMGSGRIVRRDTTGGWSLLPGVAGEIAMFHAVSSDSLLACTESRYFVLWREGAWTVWNRADDSVRAMTAPADGNVYAITNGIPAKLWVAGPAGFTVAAELPEFSGNCLHGSRSSATLYVGGQSATAPFHGLVYRYRDGVLEDLTAGTTLPDLVDALTEPSPGVLYATAGGQVWRWQGGSWSRESGLPQDEAIISLWSHPDCGVFANGHVTFFKPLGLE
jgi:hypothetical protein